MKQILTLAILLQCALTNFCFAQCTSNAPTYDLTVNTTMSLPPTSSATYLSGIICNGGNLYDSLSCCTRYIHIDAGGIYQAGPQAYGIVYVKSGGTFDAHGNNSFFGVSYEAGATILNYTGPQILCTAVYFDTTVCLTTPVNELSVSNPVTVFPDPCTDILTIGNNSLMPGMILKVYDVSGKIVLTSTFEERGKGSFAVNELSKGFYTFCITGGDTDPLIGKFCILR